MEKLPNVENVQCDLGEGPSCRIVGEEVVKALKLSKTGKAADPSEVMSEMITTTVSCFPFHDVMTFEL